MLLRRRREILHFEITESMKNGQILFIMVPSVSFPGGISHFRANLNSHEANADATALQARVKKKHFSIKPLQCS